MKYRYFVRAKAYAEGDILYQAGRISKGRTQHFVKRSGEVTVHKKKGTITWMDTKEAEGYQLLVADNREMKNGKKFPFGKVAQIGADQITMPRGSYYIAIRQYIMRNGKRFVSAYHGAKRFVVK